jgi:hypothetical protein
VSISRPGIVSNLIRKATPMKKLTTLILFTLIGTFLSFAQETPAPAKMKKLAVTKAAAPTNAPTKAE